MKNQKPLAKVRIRWLSKDKGGRSAGPPSGPWYAPTATLADSEEHFSVFLKSPNGSMVQDLDFGLLAPENLPAIVQKLIPSTRLKIREGNRVVAEAEILSLYDNAMTSAANL